MSMPLASVFTPSYNKSWIAIEAVSSILNQDWPHIEYWVLENSDDDGRTRATLAPYMNDPRVRYEEIELTWTQRAGRYPTAVLLNEYYPKATGDYIFYLSDDDVLDPSCVRRCIEFMEADRENRWVCWFTMAIGQLFPDGRYQYERCIEAITDVGLGTYMPSVDCRIDGGQVAHRRDCLEQIPQPWYPEDGSPAHARHCDGLWIDKLAARWRFHAIGQTLMTKRHTELSLWDRA